jgi:hypothetical protein
MRPADLRGTGCVKCGSRNLGDFAYQIDMDISGQANLVKFEVRPKAKNGDKLHLTLEDGRMLDCQILDASPFCAVVGEGPYFDRRSTVRD